MWRLICNPSVQEPETGVITANWLTGIARTVNCGFKGNRASILTKERASEERT